MYIYVKENKTVFLPLSAHSGHFFYHLNGMIFVKFKIIEKINFWLETYQVTQGILSENHYIVHLFWIASHER